MARFLGNNFHIKYPKIWIYNFSTDPFPSFLSSREEGLISLEKCSLLRANIVCSKKCSSLKSKMEFAPKNAHCSEQNIFCSKKCSLLRAKYILLKKSALAPAKEQRAFVFLLFFCSCSGAGTTLVKTDC